MPTAVRFDIFSADLMVGPIRESDRRFVKLDIHYCGMLAHPGLDADELARTDGEHARLTRRGSPT